MPDWLTIVVSWVGSTGLVSGLFLLLNGRLDRRRAIAVEKFKEELSEIADRRKFDYKRRTTDFDLYTQRKHQVYARLYRLLLVAEGHLESLTSVRQLPTFDEYSVQDMQAYLRKYPVIEGYIDQLVSGWEQNRQTAISTIRDYLLVLDFQKADHARQAAKNYAVANALYLSEPIESRVNDILTMLGNRFVLDRTVSPKRRIGNR